MRTRADRSRSVAQVAPDVIADEGRRRHYGGFYGLDPVVEGAGVVLGNCQAESLRVVLGEVAGPTVRIPPVHELTADDVPHLERVLRDARFVVMQPIRDDYHGLAVGSEQVRARLRTGTPVVMVPPVRYAGLHPAWVPLHVAGVDEDPPLVAYHDVRTLCRAAGIPVAGELPPASVRKIGDESVWELRRREESAGTIPVADLLRNPEFRLLRTPNHPADPVLLEMGARILQALGHDEGPHDPGRPLLASVEAPRETWVVDAWDLDETPRRTWLVGGREVEPDEIAGAHAGWYRDHPEFVRGALERLSPLVARWRAA